MDEEPFATIHLSFDDLAPELKTFVSVAVALMVSASANICLSMAERCVRTFGRRRGHPLGYDQV